MLRTILRRGDGVHGCRVLVACSGGGDSVALLASLVALRANLKLELAVAHADHNLRPESKEECEYVKNLCSRYGLGFVLGSLGVTSHATETGQGIETAARELRWKWLKDESAKFGSRWIATGHTIEDHTETVMLRLARGSGAGCLTGLPAIQPPRWSPLIECTREGLRTYLRSSGVEWREDYTNDLDFTPRNRWRKHLAGFRSEAPSIDRHLWETHRQIAEILGLKDDTVASWRGVRWEISSEGYVWLEIGIGSRDLVWILESCFKELGIHREPGHLFDLATWVSKTAARPIRRQWKWGNWSLWPQSGGACLQLGFHNDANQG
ncbi:MAG: tRNA lysidine(34) synthetase TilS [Holophagaceae bacterium]|nr:tRNA lysidine(34) synthetase TilS [Holophagaceae bacterium]